MKIPDISIIAALTLGTMPLPTVAQQQEPDEVLEGVGFLQIVNGVSTGKPTFIEFGDVETGESEIPPGATSGMMGLAPGDYEWEVSNARCKPKSLTGSVTIEAGKTFALVFFNEIKPAKKDGDEDEYHLRQSALTRQQEHTEPKLSLVSLSSRKELSLKVGPGYLNLPQYQAVEVEVKPGAAIKIESGEHLVGTVEAIAPVHYVAFLFDDDSESGLGFSQIQHQQITYDPPKSKGEEDAEDDEKKRKVPSTAE